MTATKQSFASWSRLTNHERRAQRTGDRTDPEMTSEPADSLKAAIPTDAQTISTPEILGPMLDVHDPHESITAHTVQRDWQKARLILAAALR